MQVSTKLKRAGLISFAAVSMLGTFSVQGATVDAAALGTPLTNSFFTPTPAPDKFLNIWNTNGYALQPESHTYTVVGNPVTLNTDAGRSVWSVMSGLLDAPHYRWYKSDDGVNWSAVPEWQNGHRKNLSVPSNEVGRTWYQMDTQYYNYLTGWALKTHIYSDVAEVNIVDTPTNASGVSVTADSDYIYNNDNQNNVTFAHANVNPISSTGKVTWSVDNTNLATVDSTGKITANDRGLSGVVKVTGTFHNMDSSFVVGTTYVEVGGGIADQTVQPGQAATFSLKGDTSKLNELIQQNNADVQWYKKAPGTNKAEYIGQYNSAAYTTGITSVADNGTQYRTKIILKDGSNKKSVYTNWSTLHVTYNN
ncbi:Ig-like domain-containing protein [Companilactobacillus crustorum]|uniref:Ig-like domain-containing protein n=1 Tax=Companilactobacillus crustorum TaxID=392416 RepID=UPI0009579A15|nr:Ig-like domain-containing protein [Companilactobacillus crustorum]APU72220.1 hypothetical protein BI355_1921 [Companilactobacillus crustorum]